VWTDPGVYFEKLRLEHSASNYRKKKSIECQVGRKTIQSIAGHGHDDPRGQRKNQVCSSQKFTSSNLAQMLDRTQRPAIANLYISPAHPRS
jgi:hypothetical protein